MKVLAFFAYCDSRFTDSLRTPFSALSSPSEAGELSFRSSCASLARSFSL